MLTVNSQNDVPIRLTEERWQHITSRHPEMYTQQAEVLETVSAPELIQAGDSGELLAVRFYPQTPLTSKFLVVAYREVTADAGFILTADFTNRPSTRRVTLWTR